MSSRASLKNPVANELQCRRVFIPTPRKSCDITCKCRHGIDGLAWNPSLKTSEPGGVFIRVVVSMPPGRARAASSAAAFLPAASIRVSNGACAFVSAVGPAARV
eukprot:24215-Pelagococcus_subviridis.AAC.5